MVAAKCGCKMTEVTDGTSNAIMVAELRAHRGPKPSTIYLVDLDDVILRAFEFALRESQQP